MKKIIILSFFLLAATANSQSVLTIESGTTLGVLTGADLCANIINGTGTLYGGGTICGGIVVIEPITTNELPDKFKLKQNYPNPFNPKTIIKFDIPSKVKGEMSNVKLVVFDILGSEIETLVDEKLKSGTYEVDFDGANYTSGVYFYEISIGNFRETRKMVLLK
jgi:hypothetical protein